PAAAEIGRDSAEIAQYASAGARIAANASASLTPTGAPLGRRTQATPPPTPPRLAPAPAPTPTPTPTPMPTPAPTRAVVVAEARPAATLPSSPATLEPDDRPTLAEAFSDLKPASTTPATAPGAVDISRLAAAQLAPVPAAKESPAKPAVKAPVEKPKPKPKVQKPAEPARIWVQLGVGRNTAAFAFDWRKLAKQADGALDGKGPWAVKYGATNRMLAGPYPSDGAARAAIKRLKDQEIDALPFTSDAGEKVTKVE
ncbi:MAG TPA: SPOR domain-containing protein, partial [Qipengyuania sp.]|nr:SPOR domain-containing protein [Qipengyuania sp.]